MLDEQELGAGEPVLRSYNGHTLELRETDWRCLHCGHWFDAATDANGWKCGEPCVHGGQR